MGLRQVFPVQTARMYGGWAMRFAEVEEAATGTGFGAKRKAGLRENATRGARVCAHVIFRQHLFFHPVYSATLDNIPAPPFNTLTMTFHTPDFCPVSRSRSTFRRGLRATRRGFTLLEILIVLAILGMLTGLLLKHVTGADDTAKRSAAGIFVNSSCSIPLTRYRMAIGDYPSTADGLQALLVAPSSKQGRWSGPYIENESLTDPWSEPFQYRYPGVHNKTSYDLWSKGPDRQDGTADDIGNWTVKEQPVK